MESGLDELREVLSGRCMRSTSSINSSFVSCSKSLRFIRFLNAKIAQAHPVGFHYTLGNYSRSIDVAAELSYCRI